MEDAHPQQDRQGRQLGDGEQAHQPRSRRDAQDVDGPDRAQERDDEQVSPEGMGEHGEEPASGVGDRRRDAGRGEHGAQPHQHSDEEADVGAERRLGIAVRAAAGRHAAGRRGETEHDARHPDPATEIGQGRGGPDVSRQGRGQDEDAGAHHRVEDRHGEAGRADALDQPRIPMGSGLRRQCRGQGGVLARHRLASLAPGLLPASLHAMAGRLQTAQARHRRGTWAVSQMFSRRTLRGLG